MVDFNYVHKYPSTPYSSLSPGRDPNDKVIDAASCFEGKEVVVSIKMDGESCSMYRDHIHARSLDSRHHPSRDWVKAFWASIRHNIPQNWRVCGENLYAQHSIVYEILDSYFLGFSIWNDENVCLSWDDTLEWFNIIDIIPVPVVYRGEYSDAVIQTLYEELDTTKDEGLVIRLADSFKFEDFGKSMAKVVRCNHVTTSQHWMSKEVITNRLKHGAN